MSDREFYLSEEQIKELNKNGEIFMVCPNEVNHDISNSMCLQCFNYNNFKLSMKDDGSILVELIENADIRKYNLIMRETLGGQRLT